MRRVLLIVLAGALVATLPACGIFDTGRAHRYRDVVFDAADVQPDVQYGTAVDAEGEEVALRLDLYQPAGDSEGGRPALVTVHGGGFVLGDKSWNVEEAQDFARRGYVVANIDYRMQPPQEFSFALPWEPELIGAVRDAQHDAQAAVRWLRAHAAELRIDPDRIGITGWSAGAMTALLVAANPNDPGDSGNAEFDSDVRVAVSVMGCADPSLIPGASPPVQMHHGTGDPTVPFACAEATDRALRDLGTDVEFLTYTGGHEIWISQRDEIRSRTSRFLAEELAPHEGLFG